MEHLLTVMSLRQTHSSRKKLLESSQRYCGARVSQHLSDQGARAICHGGRSPDDILGRGVLAALDPAFDDGSLSQGLASVGGFVDRHTHTHTHTHTSRRACP